MEGCSKHRGQRKPRFRGKKLPIVCSELDVAPMWQPQEVGSSERKNGGLRDMDTL